MSGSKATSTIPSLAEWMKSGPTGDQLKEMTAECLRLTTEGLEPEEARFLRIMQTFVVACVEQMNRETAIDASPEGVSAAMSMWSRSAGYVTIMALASVTRDDAPFRRIAKVFTEEFKIGAKMAADPLIAQEASDV